jgi:hypothetical protein
VNLKSIKSYRVAKYLLLNKVTSQTKVSQDTNVAIGYVNEVLHHLSDLGIVKIEYGETKLIDYARLLDKISFDRSFKKLIQETIRLPTSTIIDTENMLRSFCINNRVRYAFTGFTGLRRYYEYHISYPMVHIYVQNTNDFLTLEKGEGVIPVVLLKIDRPDVFLESKKIENVNVCEKIQIIIDLYSSGIGRDAAIKYYRDSIWKTEMY